MITLEEAAEDDHTLCFDVPQPELTGVERFQQRLHHHMKTRPHTPKEKTSSAQDGGVAGVLSKEAINKLSETPGELETKESAKFPIV